MAKKPKDESKKAPDKTPSKSKNKLIAIGIIAAIIAGAAYFLHKSDNTVDSGYASIDGIPCETQEYSTFHIHAHLDTFVNGQHVTVPQYVGIEDNKCLYWLHTHDNSGIIHIEAPQQQNFTLSQFIDVWKNTGSTQPPSGDPIIFVNGQEVSTNLANTQLNAHDEIAIVYGQTPPNIPSFYQFPEGL
ncbi:MAG: hypothetical protein KGI25_01735 [Thaumarchaeota archaeon]|nr:hypothetical protein [Nitrososphaerota archaeon]